MSESEDGFASYVLDEAVGHGGTATVYRAHHASEPSRAVALKVLDDRHRQPAQLDRIRREFDFAERLTHPQIVTMYEQGTGWLTMELIGGGQATRLQTLADRLSALADIASALDYAHHDGIVHCDVKPSNILVHQDFSTGGAVLIDFGVAHSVAEHVRHKPTHVEASLPYAAPELLRGRVASAAADEYALACTAVELLTGTPPFVASTAMGLIEDHLSSPVPRYSRRYAWITHAFDSILAKAMAKDADHRYPTCTEFVTLATRALT